ncbi:tetratricopeptide repeat protein [Candidatus Lokiarchaeum ossiferum]|uniref:tetratricopeptide repeat protein n=1 Tax=Candidatus Lokiarchaeum ossiferum TaxID=2951803 RepID=UPI00352DB322
MTFKISYYLKPLSKKKTRILTVLTLALIIIIILMFVFEYHCINLLSLTTDQKKNLLSFVTGIRDLGVLALFLGLLLKYLPMYLDAPTQLRLVENLMHVQSYVKAEKIVNDLITSFPQNWKYLNLMARIKIEKGDLSSAWKWITLAEIWAKSRKDEISNNRSLICFINQDYKNAWRINEEVLENNNKDLIAILRKLEIYRCRKEWDLLFTFFGESEEVLKHENELYLDAFLCYYDSLKALRKNDQIITYMSNLELGESLPANTLYNFGTIFHDLKDKKNLEIIFLKICERRKQELDEEANNQIDLWKIFLNSS